jgi:hypothetical protein
MFEPQASRKKSDPESEVGMRRSRVSRSNEGSGLV